MNDFKHFRERSTWSFNNNKSFREHLDRNKILKNIRKKLIENKFKGK